MSAAAGAVPLGTTGASARLRVKLLLLEPEFRDATHHMWRADGLLPRYRTYLCTMHAVIRASVPLMELALDRARVRAASGDPLAAPLAAYLEEHIREEEGHDAWLLEDLRAAGGDPEDALGPLPSPWSPRSSGPSTTGSSTTTRSPCSATSPYWRATRPPPASPAVSPG